ncbi:MAG TPA: glycoside hydrolase family 71/99-like protein [Puia sp.]|jgi:hypothetical protein
MKQLFACLFTLFLLMACRKNELTHTFSSGKTTARALSPTGDVVGKITAGYQGWFQAAGDGGPFNNWQHTNLECWPDMRQYTKTYGNVQFTQDNVVQPPYTGTLGNGQPVTMFSDWDQSSVNLHFSWMQQYGVDCAALQRFGAHFDDPRAKKSSDSAIARARRAAEAYGRKFYVMYDISGWTNFQTQLKSDWTSFMQQHTASTAYAHQNGKPVVCVWGIGVSGRPGDVSTWSDLLTWFKTQGCYVIAGAPGNFNSDTVNRPAYLTANMLMGWRVGASPHTNFVQEDSLDRNLCTTNGLDYQVAIYPGTSFYNGNGTTKNIIPRNHGDFMWTQFAAAKTANIPSVYISMFDEINEATGIMPCAEDSTMIPKNEYFLTLDADGTHVSADFYLRLTTDGGRMIKGQIPLTATHPTPHVLTPPVSLTPHVQSGTSILVNVSAVTDAPCYNFKRSVVKRGPYVTVAANLAGPSFTDIGLTPATTYYYVVTTGHINAGESAISREVSATTNP